MTRDRSFDNIAQKFTKNIYDTAKGKIREAVLQRDLIASVDWLGKDTTKRILDVGGGQGQLALFLAELGHQVTLVDISKDMLELANRSATQRGVADKLITVHSPLQAIPDLNLGQFDLVLCHAVLEWLVDQRGAIATLNSTLKPDAWLSLMYYNKDAKRLANILYGNFDYVNNDLKVKKKVSLNPNQPLDAKDVNLWLSEFNLQALSKTGVRCFHDYMRDVTKILSDFDTLLQLELQHSRQEPYASIGRYTHLMCRAIDDTNPQ